MAFKSKSSSKVAVCRRLNEFKHGLLTLTVEEKSDLLLTAFTEENVLEVKKFFQENSFMLSTVQSDAGSEAGSRWSYDAVTR
ncbi:hypothetical protein EVAR_9850_1 [Eumeta japonica]|uniref:Uncharacterized protein n=1 Tax=Eumeta variegata TaxID=151549 RepID=A0A4C1TQ87_EUMVA|nr:hypothetical protein EVAR_9850_1 [Eumeta japonica]